MKKIVNGWSLTGHPARMDDDGYLWFVGRKDDLITSAGYRIGPGEIEFVDSLPMTATGKIMRRELKTR